MDMEGELIKLQLIVSCVPSNVFAETIRYGTRVIAYQEDGPGL